MVKKKLFTVTFGGWYQRTTLHLSEIYDLFALGRTTLKLNQEKVSHLRAKLNLTYVSREADTLEYILCKTSDGIEIRYYEDGLYVLTLVSDDINQSQFILSNYYDVSFAPAIAYIFSLGAPTPKVLADIKTTHPTVISAVTASAESTFRLLKLGEVYSRISSRDITVYKTPENIVVLARTQTAHLHDLVEMQIFFREFKDQLHRYLNLHREIWEEISEVKERGSIAGNQVETLRNRLDSYQKTINLINSRLSQMGSYVHTRASIARQLSIEDQLASIFQYKFETLTDTHTYIKEVWKMTADYVATAIQVINEVKAQSSANGINSLRLITTIGVLSGIFGYLSKDSFPKFTYIGLWYFVVLILVTWLINQLITTVYQNLKYQLKFSDQIIKK